MYKERILTRRLEKLAGAFPCVVVTGARQVGKSTLVRHVFGDMDYVVFDPVVDVGNARRDPDLFLDNHPSPVILDEIQYAPELVAAVKRRIDRNRSSGQYIVTGSQQWSVMKSIGESLAGRAVFLTLEGFCLAEIHQKPAERSWLERWLDDPQEMIGARPNRPRGTTTLYEQLWRGWLPEADSLALDLIPDYYNGYLRTYIERDVRMISDTADWQQFGRFVRLSSALTAQEINYSQLGRELGITPQTARRWLSTLSATFQWFEMPAYSGNTVKRVSGKPKGYLADTGMVCALQMVSSAKSLGGHPLAVALFETAVAGEIRKLSGTLATPPSFYHWRSYGGAEVDIVLERDGVLYPIEVKLASQPSSADTRGLGAFRETYAKSRVAPGLVVAPASDFARISETDYVLPWDVV